MIRAAALIVLGALTLATALPSVGVGAEGPTRTEYVSHLEGICKPRAEATERETKGVASDVRAERFTVAATKFARAARIFAVTVRTIAAVPRPPADMKTLARWFADLDSEEAYLEEIATQLRARHANRAQHLTTLFIRAGNVANDVVLDFGFNYCRFKFSRFA